MLHTRGPHAIATFDTRFRQITSYPPDTIRKFSHNVSGMKKLAARDYEDILQCCGPCFEGLFLEEDDIHIQQLIFTMAHWHALAKLRVHTTTTIASHYDTVETDREHEARKRVEIRHALATGNATQSTESGKRAVKFNLTTYKMHSLGDYPEAIETFGTTDSYSSQIGELEHRRAKSHARRSNQARLVESVSDMDHRQSYIVQRGHLLSKFEKHIREEQKTNIESNSTDSIERGELTDSYAPTEHHTIGARGETMHIRRFMEQNAGDPALVDFLPNLKNYFLVCFGISPAENLLFSELQRQQIVIPSGTLVRHATCQVSYTTYDVRRTQDTVNPRTKHHFIMTRNQDDDPDHPFWYAKVIGIYHANVLHLGLHTQAPRRIEFLWVRWLELAEVGGWDLCRMDRIAYTNSNSTIDSFGFIDPATVIRSCHLIPSFKYHQATKPAAPSISYDDQLEGDWSHYYVNRFVDRDMAVRYMPGVGIGHLNVTSNSEVYDAESMDIDELEPTSHEPHLNAGQDPTYDSANDEDDFETRSHASYDSICEEQYDL
ncbi:hypothetical protein RhiJN_24125 [Ceratobasidium sp. AG-Ba]|nr:hypothetical protein RhiJN_24125 [Ceratobasidium sp. AG-Ba]